MSAITSDTHRNQRLPADHDYKNVMVVASAWLLFYFLIIGGALMTTQGSAFLAQVSDVLAQ